MQNKPCKNLSVNKTPVKMYFKKIQLSSFIISILFSYQVIAQSASFSAASELVKRILPKQYNQIELHIIPPENNNDVFEIKSQNNKIILSGNNNNSLAVALNYYLKYYCHTDVTWYAEDAIQVPGKLPAVPLSVKVISNVPKRFFLNYCTFGYTFTWWKWKNWERMIDWMALNGINMPLAISGEEAVWYNVWKQLGLTDSQIRNFFTGPSFLPWHRMSNIDGWHSPLPMSYINNQKELQEKIVKRERELNMTPVLPAFAGHVPKALKTVFPNIKLTKLNWCDFTDEYKCYFLDPQDSLFNVIQKKFLAEQTKLYGTDHIYGADPFNELTPPSWDAQYLAGVSHKIFEGITQFDKDAQWLQMGWLFLNSDWTNERIDAFLNAVPQSKMILLDYFCENTEFWKRTDYFFGQPYIWCYLGNFGGNTMFMGNLKDVGKRIDTAFIKRKNNFYGIGSTLEGFDMNPFMYEYVFEKAWNLPSLPDYEWITQWSERRYGNYDEEVADAWKLMIDSIYISKASTKGTLTNVRPGFTNGDSWPEDATYKYSNKVLCKIWQQLLNNKNFKNNVYNFDVVNIGRQVIGNYFMELRNNFAKAFQQKNLNELKKNGDKMLNLLDDMETLLNTQPNLLLGKWIADARSFGLNEEEKNYYEQDARMLLTTWGKKGGELTEYANRSWAGLTKGYYKQRWKMFIEDVEKSAEDNWSFNEKKFDENVKDFEWQFTQQKEKYNSKPIGNGFMVAEKLCNKYAKEISGN